MRRDYRQHRRRGFMSEAIHLGRRALGGVDYFFRTAGPYMKQAAQVIAPMIAKSNPALGAGVAAVAQAADGYSQIRSQLGD